MKRIIAILITVIITVSGCGIKSNENVDKNPYLISCSKMDTNDEDTVSGCDIKNNENIDKNLYLKSCSKMDTNDEETFHTILLNLCSQELWSSRDCYDAAGYLIIPMHYSFKSDDDIAVYAFHELFMNFTTSYINGGEDEFNEISRTHQLQWLYFCSQYLSLCASYDAFRDVFIPELLKICVERAEKNLYDSKATWGTEDTVEEHLKQVLAGKNYKYHYYSLVTDGDMFTLAVLCDAVYVSFMRDLPITSKMESASALAYDLFSSDLLNTVTDDGGWLFQVGVWQDYKDFLYAGNTDITEGMQINPRSDITWDVSHFRRLAFFLTSYESAQVNEDRKDLFDLRREQLCNQLKKCIVNVDGNWVQTSFMDGTNGVYRYEYHENGVGHSNYSHSSSLIQGWWAVLYQDWIFDVYADVLSGFPYPQNETNPYWDIITVREQNTYFDADTAWNSGWYECVVKCAVQLGKLKKTR